MKAQLMVVAVAMSTLVGSSAIAQSYLPFSLNLHLANPPASLTVCAPSDLPDAMLRCQTLVPQDTYPPSVEYPLGPVTVWLVLGGVDRHPSYDGVAGVRFGIEYDSVVTGVQWVLCTGGEMFPTYGAWPESGSATAITWEGNCYHVTENPDGLTKVGFFVLSGGLLGAGGMRTIADPSVPPPLGGPNGAGVVATCPPVGEVRIWPFAFGRCSWGTTTGFAGCWFIPSPVEESTWGRIKAQFGGPRG